MNIYAKKGHKVIVTEITINNGYPFHVETAHKHLKVDQVYTVNHTKVDGWHTDVFLEEIPGVSFNSVQFKDHVESN